jgi:hypothetical protein
MILRFANRTAAEAVLTALDTAKGYPKQHRTGDGVLLDSYTMHHYDPAAIQAIEDEETDDVLLAIDPKDLADLVNAAAKAGRTIIKVESEPEA